MSTFAEPMSPNSFWQRSAYADEHHPSLSPEQIATVEKQLGFVLPDLLRRLYHIHNGGRVSTTLYAASPTEEGRHPFPDSDLLRLDEMQTLQSLAEEVSFGSDEDDWTTSIADCDQLLVIARHGTEWCLCLDYREEGEPQVVFFELLAPAHELLRVPSFVDFLHGLSPD